MGADLFRETSDPTRHAERAALKASGELYDNDLWYFRDSYNQSSLFWMLDLSWWQDMDAFLGPKGDGVVEQVKDEEDGNCYDDHRLHPEGMRRLAAEVRGRRHLIPMNCAKQGVPEAGNPITNFMGQPDRELDVRYFEEKCDRFLSFLEAAAAAGDTIACSV